MKTRNQHKVIIAFLAAGLSALLLFVSLTIFFSTFENGIDLFGPRGILKSASLGRVGDRLQQGRQHRSARHDRGRSKDVASVAGDTGQDPKTGDLLVPTETIQGQLEPAVGHNEVPTAMTTTMPAITAADQRQTVGSATSPPSISHQTSASAMAPALASAPQ